MDDGLKIWERFSPRPLRKRAIDAARLWLEERLAVPGGLGGIYPAMANSVLALRVLGYPEDHPLILGQLKEIEALAVERGDELYYQPCPSPVWDTSLAANALIESDLPPDHPSLQRAADWMLSKQVLMPGDWQVKRPHVQPGGWAFQYDNPYYPDLDDTGMVLMALERIQGVDADRTRLAKERGLGWFLGMQNQDGGWASFDADNNRIYLNNIPFADHGALLDPSTEDLTGRGLELLGMLGYSLDFEPADRALDVIRRTQRHDGPWYGRWGVNYIYGTWSVMRGLAAVGADPRQEFIQRAVRWLIRHQNADGGWGETCESYARPELAGRGPSMPEPDLVGAAGALRRGHDFGSGRAGGHRLSAPHAEAGRIVGRPALERHRFSARLLPQVPPLRALLPALGSGRLSPRACMTEPPIAPLLRPFEGLGGWVVCDRRVARSVRGLLRPDAGGRRDAALQAVAAASAASTTSASARC